MSFYFFCNSFNIFVLLLELQISIPVTSVTCDQPTETWGLEIGGIKTKMKFPYSITNAKMTKISILVWATLYTLFCPQKKYDCKNSALLRHFKGILTTVCEKQAN